MRKITENGQKKRKRAGGPAGQAFRLVRRGGAVLLAAGLLYAGIFMAAFCLLPPLYEDSYQRVIVRQYDSLKETESPRVIVLGTSYITFSADTAVMEEELDMPCQIFGCHVGMGVRYFFDLVKDFIGEGDIVVYPIWEADVNYYGTELIMTGIEGRTDLLLKMPPGAVKGVLAGSRDIITKKIYEPLRDAIFRGVIDQVSDPEDPIYHISSFDEKGTMTARREECLIDDPVPDDQKVRYSQENYPAEYIQFLNEFDAYCRERGASFYLSYPTVLDEGLANSQEELDAFDAWLKSQATAPVITDIRDTVMEREEMYNAVMHANSLGAERYSRMLAEDVKEAIALRP